MTTSKGRIHSLESFGTLDGPGVRFVVFMQGCPLRCKYCHNPDTWAMDGGKMMTVEEILQRFDKCKEFLKNGGITVTGGEPLMQRAFLKELFTACKKKGIHTCLDTSGITFRKDNHEEMDELMRVCDLVMLDIKHIDPVAHRELTAQDNANILDFAQYLASINKPMWIRHVVVPGITLEKKPLHDLGYFLGGCRNIKALDVLPYHVMGVAKYKQLGFPYPLQGVEPATQQQAIDARQIILYGMRQRMLDDETSKANAPQ